MFKNQSSMEEWTPERVRDFFLATQADIKYKHDYTMSDIEYDAYAKQLQQYTRLKRVLKKQPKGLEKDHRENDTLLKTYLIELSQMNDSESKKKNTEKIIFLQEWKKLCNEIARKPTDLFNLIDLYVKRSALLNREGRVSEAITDIDNALKLCKIPDVKMKLLNRKVRLLHKIDTNLAKSILDESYEVSKDIDDKCEDWKEILDDMHSLACLLKDQKNNEIYHKSEKKAKPSISSLISNTENIPVCLNKNEEYGKHLIARRDIMPGEVIFIEKPVVTAIQLENKFAYCGYCMKFSLTCIPCDHCSWCMYCSDECKTASWQNFHEFECSFLPKIVFSIENSTPIDILMFMSLRLLMREIKNAGGILELKKHVLEIYEKGIPGMHEYKQGTFRAIYCFANNCTQESTTELIECTARLVYHLIADTNLIGIDVTKKWDTRKILKDERVVIISSLFLRLMKSLQLNSFQIYGDCAPEFPTPVSCMGSCVASLSSLINHQCQPNAHYCWTEDKQVAVYATMPIKKNEQIFFNYLRMDDCISAADRIAFTGSIYNFVCKCPYCREHRVYYPFAARTMSDYFNEEDKKFLQYNDEWLFRHIPLDKDLPFSKEWLSYLSRRIYDALKQYHPCSAIIVGFTTLLETLFDRWFRMKTVI